MSKGEFSSTSIMIFNTSSSFCTSYIINEFLTCFSLLQLDVWPTVSEAACVTQAKMVNKSLIVFYVQYVSKHLVEELYK